MAGAAARGTRWRSRDFALLRQARWREAIASTFDRPALLPYLGHLDRIEVHYAATRRRARDAANVVRPLYHVAWLAARLGMTVVDADAPPARSRGAATTGCSGTAGAGCPVAPPAGRIDGAARARRSSSSCTRRAAAPQLWVEVTAYADGVIVQASLDARRMPERRFHAPRRRESDLLAETIDAAGRDQLTAEVLAMTARLVAR